MSTLSQPKEERRTYKAKGCEYLLNDKEKTAWIVKGPRVGRRRRYRIPETVDIDGVPYKVESVEIGAFGKAQRLRHLVIPDSIEFVDEYNFYSLQSLRSIYIGKGLTYLSSWIFQRNKNLRSFVISKENPHLCVENGIVYTTDGKCAVSTPFNVRHLNIKEGVEAIENVAFWWNPNLETISLPSTLKSIGDNSFAGCPKIKKVVFPEGFERFISQCFWDCDSLETVELPSTLKEMDDETFYRCKNLKTVIIRAEHMLLVNAYCILPYKFIKNHYNDFDRDNQPIYLPKGCTLKVPKALVEEYKAHPLWAMATNVEEID